MLTYPVLIAITWVCGRLAIRIVLIARRSERGSWWLRLSAHGFDVNNGILRPRRYRWRDIDTFMVVAPSSGDSQVGFAARTKADGTIAGHRVRSVEEAVDLMNAWHRRYRAAEVGSVAV